MIPGLGDFVRDRTVNADRDSLTSIIFDKFNYDCVNGEVHNYIISNDSCFSRNKVSEIARREIVS